MKIVEVWTFQTVWNTKKSSAPFAASERRGMVFLKTGGVLAGLAGYFLKWAGYGRDTGGVFQVLET